jgi:hypothetical protein
MFPDADRAGQERMTAATAPPGAPRGAVARPHAADGDGENESEAKRNYGSCLSL